VREVVRKGKDSMPAYSAAVITDQELADLADYVRSMLTSSAAVINDQQPTGPSAYISSYWWYLMAVSPVTGWRRKRRTAPKMGLSKKQGGSKTAVFRRKVIRKVKETER
jgi:hypothetical protein